MNQTVIGFFDDASEAQKAVEKLQQSGISRDRVDISRGKSGSSGTSSVSNERGGSPGRETSDRTTSEGRTVDREGRNTKKVTDFFNNLFGGNDKDDADRYSKVAERSKAIVTVHAQSRDEAERASELLDDCGAIDVDERASQYGSSASGSDRSSGRQNASNERDVSVPRIEENLEVGKREVETGRVRVRSRIVERPVEEHVRLREEHVHVEREQVNRPVSGELESFREGEIELTEKAEVPVVNKEARVVEEVRISKDVDDRDETVRETLRNTDVDVDRTGRGSGNRDSDSRGSESGRGII